MNSLQHEAKKQLLEMMKCAAAQGEVDLSMADHAALIKSVVMHFESFPSLATAEDILLALVRTAQEKK